MCIYKEVRINQHGRRAGGREAAGSTEAGTDEELQDGGKHTGGTPLAFTRSTTFTALRLVSDWT